MKSGKYQIGTDTNQHAEGMKNDVSRIYLTVMSPIILLITGKYDTLFGHGKKYQPAAG